MGWRKWNLRDHIGVTAIGIRFVEDVVEVGGISDTIRSQSIREFAQVVSDVRLTSVQRFGSDRYSVGGCHLLQGGRDFHESGFGYILRHPFRRFSRSATSYNHHLCSEAGDASDRVRRVVAIRLFVWSKKLNRARKEQVCRF